MKTVIFIDGENLHFSLKGMNLKEKEINWTKFLNGCLAPEDVLIRAYWYQAEKIHHTSTNPEMAARVANRITNQTGKKAEAEAVLRKANDWKKTQLDQYQRKLDFYDNLSIKYPEIEMVRKGILKIDPFKEKYLGEKGLDVALAIGMVERQEYCDKVILISGDIDYAEAIRFIKNKLKQVHIVRLFKGEPPTNKSVSKKLRELADKVIDLYETEIKESMRA